MHPSKRREIAEIRDNWDHQSGGKPPIFIPDHCWCVRCGARFEEAEIEGATACPKCGHKGVPCDVNQDVRVIVNWHELRILGIWAENWAQRNCADDPQMLEVVHAIVRRLQQQQPSLTPLTLSGELTQIKDHGYDVEGYNVAKNSVIPVNGPGAVLE